MGSLNRDERTPYSVLNTIPQALGKSTLPYRTSYLASGMSAPMANVASTPYRMAPPDFESALERADAIGVTLWPSGNTTLAANDANQPNTTEWKALAQWIDLLAAEAKDGNVDDRFDRGPVCHWSAKPRVQPLDAAGKPLVPLAERRCEVITQGRGLADMTRMQVNASCEQSASGVFYLRHLFVSGGSTRNLDLAVLIDGVKAEHAVDSWWSNDTSLAYYSTTELSLIHWDVVLLMGHASFTVFALLSIPVLHLNAVSRSRRVQPAYMRLLGMCFLLLLTVYGVRVLRSSCWRFYPEPLPPPPPSSLCLPFHSISAWVPCHRPSSHSPIRLWVAFQTVPSPQKMQLRCSPSGAMI